MTDSVVSIVYALSAPIFPVGTAVAHIAVTISDGTTPTSQNVPPGTGSVTFPNVAPGAYTAAAQAQDASGNALGSPAITTFSVLAPATISLTLPSTISVA